MLQHNTPEGSHLIQDLTDEETDEVGGGSFVLQAVITIGEHIYLVNKYARVEHW
jgi:hypothetical protein